MSDKIPQNIKDENQSGYTTDDMIQKAMDSDGRIDKEELLAIHDKFKEEEEGLRDNTKQALESVMKDIYLKMLDKGMTISGGEELKSLKSKLEDLGLNVVVYSMLLKKDESFKIGGKVKGNEITLEELFFFNNSKGNDDKVLTAEYDKSKIDKVKNAAEIDKVLKNIGINFGKIDSNIEGLNLSEIGKIDSSFLLIDEDIKLLKSKGISLSKEWINKIDEKKQLLKTIKGFKTNLDNVNGGISRLIDLDNLGNFDITNISEVEKKLGELQKILDELKELKVSTENESKQKDGMESKIIDIKSSISTIDIEIRSIPDNISSSVLLSVINKLESIKELINSEMLRLGVNLDSKKKELSPIKDKINDAKEELFSRLDLAYDEIKRIIGEKDISNLSLEELGYIDGIIGRERADADVLIGVELLREGDNKLGNYELIQTYNIEIDNKRTEFELQIKELEEKLDTITELNNSNVLEFHDMVKGLKDLGDKWSLLYTEWDEQDESEYKISLISDYKGKLDVYTKELSQIINKFLNGLSSFGIEDVSRFGDYIQGNDNINLLVNGFKQLEDIFDTLKKLEKPHDKEADFIKMNDELALYKNEIIGLLDTLLGEANNELNQNNLNLNTKKDILDSLNMYLGEAKELGIDIVYYNDAAIDLERSIQVIEHQITIGVESALSKLANDPFLVQEATDAILILEGLKEIGIDNEWLKNNINEYNYSSMESLIKDLELVILSHITNESKSLDDLQSGLKVGDKINITNSTDIYNTLSRRSTSRETTVGQKVDVISIFEYEGEIILQTSAGYINANTGGNDNYEIRKLDAGMVKKELNVGVDGELTGSQESTQETLKFPEVNEALGIKSGDVIIPNEELTFSKTPDMKEKMDPLTAGEGFKVVSVHQNGGKIRFLVNRNDQEYGYIYTQKSTGESLFTKQGEDIVENNLKVIVENNIEEPLEFPEVNEALGVKSGDTIIPTEELTFSKTPDMKGILMDNLLAGEEFKVVSVHQNGGKIRFLVNRDDQEYGYIYTQKLTGENLFTKQGEELVEEKLVIKEPSLYDVNKLNESGKVKLNQKAIATYHNPKYHDNPIDDHNFDESRYSAREIKAMQNTDTGEYAKTRTEKKDAYIENKNGIYVLRIDDYFRDTIIQLGTIPPTDYEIEEKLAEYTEEIN